ncbi:hypothetical protein JTE90_015979 [Oedothorax gibbosus]|uniref:Uncharacterized protein n=1 Tax=Oedothorax gibbosus TaxID=931172 RepID=A0AAV6VR80_9ARAC|nr:hypothetical protein JTE90_015979 [Oedothorax gibbosus]
MQSDNARRDCCYFPDKRKAAMKHGIIIKAIVEDRCVFAHTAELDCQVAFRVLATDTVAPTEFPRGIQVGEVPTQVSVSVLVCLMNGTTTKSAYAVPIPMAC